MVIKVASALPMKVAVEESAPAPTCPQCKAELTPGAKGELDFWSCPAGHGFGFTMSEAYGRVQEDELSRIWHGSESASAGKVRCPWCGVPMATVTIGVDADEAAEGQPGDGPDAAQLTLEVCRDDQFFWFDPGELDELSQDLPNREPTADEQRKIDAILAAYDHDLEQGIEAEESRGLLNRLANPIVRRHPGFARLVDHAVYGDRLDKLEAETQSAEQKLAETWHAGQTSSAA